MKTNVIIGIVVAALGLALLLFGLNATQSTAEGLRQGLTGQYSDRTTWYIIGGLVLMVGGALWAYFGGRHTRVQ